MKTASGNLVTQAEFARLAGVNRSTVHKWLKAGRIAAHPSGLIDPDAAMRMRDATESPLPHHQARKAQFEQGRMGAADMDQAEKNAPRPDSGRPATVETGAATEETPDVLDLGARLKLETWKLQKAKAERENMELDKLAGLLVERAEVDYVLADFGNTLRGLLEGLPDRLAGALAAHRGDVNAIHKALDDAAHDLLTEMSELMKRKMEALQQ
jgi:phage terminase Nu1 subunit (DNA packaging protein)